ncbi:macrolide-specific efflux system membrane fusion protein [Paenibacillus cellulosilyticus]|uniref:Macrolide-specific efflux system membrane fusion protein n=1 Tax=Paenibacillus cellulosilyticus TaxID=375489 RepID=A0A2V2YTT3_9BACL|nr:efflux RND transporter periplasmic adaptor subunit [Paenibacillus cellulosilyticus]PWV98683.1 macrolide-specific efflux system membrane fusion protein [Paenibacillus cellulosilyticus]QKS43813.1 efflux RND transporter periplasmic adaptor subunit [Paenibacillus cellulosilyticus]
MLSIEWRTAQSNRRKRGAPAFRLLISVLCLSLLSAGCTLLPQEEEKESLPQIRVPKIATKIEYPVTRQTLELTASGAGKLLSEQEDNLLFELDNQRITNVYVKAGDKVKKGQLLAALDTGDTESQIQRKQIEIAKAELDLKDALRGLDGDEAESSTQLRKQELDYGLLKDELAELQQDLTGSKLYAPYDGMIVSFTAEKGDLTQAYETIGTIADLSSLVVAVEFNTSDLDSIAPGMETVVSINAAGDYKGKVRRLPISTDQDDDEESLDSYTLIDVDKLPEGAGRGTPLSASVIVERRTNALSIPLAALRTQNSRNYVLVSNADGSKGEVDVEVGIQTSTDAEIIKGLEEGQKVVSR